MRLTDLLAACPLSTPDTKRVQLETPLDFLVVSDHAEFLGNIRQLYNVGLPTEGWASFKN